MAQSDKPSSTRRREKKAPTSVPGTRTPSPASSQASAGKPAAAPKDPAGRQGQLLHSEFQALTRRAADLELQVGDLDEQLKRARESLVKSDSRVMELQARSQELLSKAERTFVLEQEVAALRPQLEESRRRLKEIQVELKVVRDERDRLRTEVADSKSHETALEARAHEVAAQHARITALKLEASSFRLQLDESRANLKKAQEELKKAQEDLKKARDEVKVHSDRAAKASEEVRRELEASRRELEQARKKAAETQEQVLQLREVRDWAEADNVQLRTKAAEFQQAIENADARTAEAHRRIKALERELADAKDAEARARDEASKNAQAADLSRAQSREELSQAGSREERLRAEIAQLETVRNGQKKLLDVLGEKVAELERRLAEAEARKPEPPSTPLGTSPPPAPVPSAPPAAVAPTPAPLATPVPPVQSVPASASAPETTLRPQDFFGPTGDDGQQIYVLEEVLSRDALGVVYRASERSNGRKFLAHFMAGQAGEEQTKAIERAMEKLVSLPHPNILHVQGTGRRKNRLYLMMDYVEAPTLAKSNIHDVAKICAIIRDAAAAIHYAHEEGIFHGHVNPETILVTKADGKELALVKDFGLGFMQESMGPAAPSKDAPAAFRNPAYLPPEQVRTLKSPLSASIDVYGLGATLYGTLADKAPFEGKDATHVAKRVMIEDPIPVEKVRSGVPSAVGSIVRRAMAKERGLRYATAKDMADALSKYLDSVAGTS